MTVRGPSSGTPMVRAYAYRPDLKDMVDMTLSWCLSNLDPSLASKLTLCRLGPGLYSVDGRRVSLSWGVAAAGAGQLMARETDFADATELPLPVYLGQVANIVQSKEKVDQLRELDAQTQNRQGRAVTSSNLDGVSQSDRVSSMRVACEDARDREITKSGRQKGRVSGASPHSPHRNTKVNM